MTKFILLPKRNQVNKAPRGIRRAAIAPTTRGLSMTGTSDGSATVRTG